eukprot:6482830-Amphidinium_carterae.1
MEQRQGTHKAKRSTMLFQQVHLHHSLVSLGGSSVAHCGGLQVRLHGVHPAKLPSHDGSVQVTVAQFIPFQYADCSCQVCVGQLTILQTLVGHSETKENPSHIHMLRTVVSLLNPQRPLQIVALLLMIAQSATGIP